LRRGSARGKRYPIAADAELDSAIADEMEPTAVTDVYTLTPVSSYSLDSI